MPEEKDALHVSRRTVIASAALVPIAAIRSAGQNPPPAVGTQNALSAEQRKILEAFVDRIVPSDENGPGAADCGAANYIDLALTGPIAGEKQAIVDGLNAVDAFARKAHGGPFAELSAAKRDEILTAVDGNAAAGFANSRGFFTRIRRLTLEGMFSDPFYGGNKNFGGWDLIRYPGPRLGVSPDDQKMRVALKPMRMSAYGANHGH